MGLTTAQLRNLYPELVLDRRKPRCDYSKAATVLFPAGGSSYPKGRVLLKVHPRARQAFRALAATMLAYGYRFEETAGGTCVCRIITGGTDTSPHAHGVAIDINPSRNRYQHAVGAVDFPDTDHKEGALQWGKVTDMPPAMVRAIEAIKTANGQQVFEWGGRWWNIKDAMHYELHTAPANLATGINLNTVKGWPAYVAWEGGTPAPAPTPAPTPDLEEDDMLGFDIGTAGEPAVKGARAKALQLMLLDRGMKLPQHGADGAAGDETRKALHDWKVREGITAATSAGEGKIGPAEYAVLFSPAGPDGYDHSKLATKVAVDTLVAKLRAELALHAATAASPAIHPHRHDEGITGPPTK